MTFKRRLNGLTGASNVTKWHVWRQDRADDTRFTSDHAPGEALTRAELEQRPEAPGVGRIIVEYVDTPPEQKETP